MSDNIAIKITGVKKKYRLGQIGGGTLQGDLQSWWARKRGKEDPNSIVGTEQKTIGQSFLALDDINLEINQGEAVGIIGKNGAGKSTLLKLLSRVTAPTEGSIDIYGRITSMLEVGTGFHGEMTGRENVYMNGAILGMTRAEIDSKMDQIIEFSEVDKFIDTPVKRYSSGMYVKLAFSVAAHLDSEIMIMDEVLAVGDMAFQQKCLDKMSDASRTEGKTVLYVSHNMNTIRRLCTRCIVLDKGKVVYDGDVEKAIAIYMNSNSNEMTYINYLETKRAKWLKTNDLRLVECELIGKESCIFTADENVRLRYKWKNHKNIDDIGIRFEIRSMDDTPLGTTFNYDICDGKKDEYSETTIKYNFGVLAPGRYKSVITIFQSDSYGNNIDLDCVDGPTLVMDDRNNKIRWRARSWGNINFGTGQIE
ncbi:MAG: ATP-binding cassette domain-containing protein [Erysipelotrichaceae bacterium]|nr:ATP-binding cassette domain-containing protein [Erysipelotrichaceae bacterium]